VVKVCHRRRISSRIVFEHLIDALVHGSGYERIATAQCSDRTIRRRLKTWAKAGVAQRVHATALAAYDLIIGLELEEVRRLIQRARKRYRWDTRPTVRRLK
jgi:transposase